MTTALTGPKLIIMGEAGTGKTHSVGTAVDMGLETFVLMLESGMESLLGYWTDRGKPIPPNLHWHKITPPKLSFQDLADAARRINTLSLETIAKNADPNRHQHNLFINVNQALFNFTDDRTGQAYGPVDDWGPDRALVIDGLTGLSRAAMSLVVGSRPVWNPGDYQIGQKQVEGLLRLICDHCQCWFILIAHLEKELDPINGGYTMTVSTIGKALGPIIPPMFSDVIHAKREGTRWTWNTATTGVATKARNLPWRDGLEPNFKQIYDTWAARSAAAKEST
jgi:hypothetical protein